MDIWNHPNIDSNKRMRIAIALGIKKQVTYHVQKGSNTHLEQHQSCVTSSKRTAGKESLDDESWRIIRGEYTTKLIDSEDRICRRNVILMEDDRVILQRFGGVYNLENYSKMQKEQLLGRQLLTKAEALGKVHLTKNKRSTVKSNFHFGIWCATGHSKALVTADTKQDGKEEAQEAVLDFCVWLRTYIEKYVYPLVKSSRYGIAEEIKKEYNSREEIYNWLTKQDFAALAQLICHPLYSTFSPFSAYTDIAHLDENDADFSCLVNFGARSYLDLPQYKIKIDLQPFDVVFFKCNTLKHCTSKNLGERFPEKRWAVSCYLRKRLQSQARKDLTSASDDLVATALRSQKKLLSV